MKKGMISVVLVLVAAIVFLCSCSADNSRNMMICKTVEFDLYDGKLAVTVEYSSPGSGEGITSSFTAPDAGTAVQILLSGDVMYKSMNKLVLGDGIDEKTQRDILIGFINNDEFQLKCNVIHGGKNCGTLTEYYRSVFNGGKR